MSPSSHPSRIVNLRRVSVVQLTETHDRLATPVYGVVSRRPRFKQILVFCTVPFRIPLSSYRRLTRPFDDRVDCFLCVSDHRNQSGVAAIACGRVKADLVRTLGRLGRILHPSSSKLQLWGLCTIHQPRHLHWLYSWNVSEDGGSST
jgi:hypothetical protein